LQGVASNRSALNSHPPRFRPAALQNASESAPVAARTPQNAYVHRAAFTARSHTRGAVRRATCSKMCWPLDGKSIQESACVLECGAAAAWPVREPSCCQGLAPLSDCTTVQQPSKAALASEGALESHPPPFPLSA